MKTPHSKGVCAVFVLSLFLPTLDVLCYVLCCVYAYGKLCVRVSMCTGPHMRRHALTVLISCVYVYCPKPPPLLGCPLHAKHARMFFF